MENIFKIMVTGGRDFREKEVLWNVLDSLFVLNGGYNRLVIMGGGAKGADEAAKEWAEGWVLKSGDDYYVTYREYPANWEEYGKSAGPRRNQDMISDGPNLVVACPGGRGTADAVRRARMAEIPVVEVVY